MNDYDIYNSAVLFLKLLFAFRLRDDAPTFHTCCSKPTEARLQVRLFTGLACWKLPRASLWKKLTPQHVAPKIWSEASSLGAKCQTQCWQRPTRAKCVVLNCHEGVSNYEQDSIWFRCEPVRPTFSSLLFFCTTMCHARVSVNSAVVRGETMLRTLKDFWGSRPKVFSMVILPTPTRTENFAENGSVGATVYTPSSIRYKTSLQSCSLQKIIRI